MIIKARKKQFVIEAVIWDGTNLKEIIEFTGLHESAKHLTWKQYEELVKKEGLKIFTLEGKLNALVGDYIIKGVKGEFYPCKPDIFEMTYKIDNDLKEKTASENAIVINNSNNFIELLREAINKCSKENCSDTPDYILSEYLNNCLNSFNLAIQSRSRYYSNESKPLENIVARTDGVRKSKGILLEKARDYYLRVSLDSDYIDVELVEMKDLHKQVIKELEEKKCIIDDNNFDKK